jgi:hypothetical protein
LKQLCSLLFVLLLVIPGLAAVVEVDTSSAPANNPGHVDGSPHVAVSPMPLNPDVLYDTGYVYPLEKGVATAPDNSWVSADDFIISGGDGEIDYVLLYWLEHYSVSSLGITFRDDNGGSPGSILETIGSSGWGQTSTGDSQWGYTIYEVEAPLDSNFAFTDGDHYWWHVDIPSGAFVFMCAQTNSYDEEVYFSDSGGSSWIPSTSQWGAPYDFCFTLEGTLGGGDDVPPAVSGQDPADGAVDVPVDSDIVFHATDDDSGIDTATIDFTAEDTTLSGGALTMVSPLADISGTLDVDDSDPLDVVCTFTPDADLPPDMITCTVAGTLADNAGNTMGSDEVWSFEVLGYDVEPASWGYIKSLD